MSREAGGAPPQDGLLEALLTHYGLAPATLTPLPGGYIHQVWRAGEFAVKVYQGADWTPASLTPTLEAQALAAEAGLPVPAARRTGQGDWLAPSPAGWVAVSEYRPGARLDAGTVTPEAAGEIGVALGRLHRVLATVPVTAAPFVPDSGEVRQRAARLLADARRGAAAPGAAGREPDEMDRFAAMAAEFRLASLERAPIDPATYEGEVWQVVHGDYYPGNLLFEPDGRVASIVDWDFAGPRWRGMEVARALVETALAADGRLDRSRAAAFLAGYTSVQPLTAAERRHMFQLWYDYLLFSLYPLPLRYQPGAVLPKGWQGLARRRHGMLVLLHDHMAELQTWTTSVGRDIL